MSGHVNIGVFIPNDVQLLDAATADVFGCMAKEYLQSIPDLPKHIIAAAPSVKHYWIGSPAHQGRDIPSTSSAALKATHLYTDEAVAPGKLDFIIVPGPHPGSTFDPAALDWLKRQADTDGVDILSVCTGMFICAAAGVADGKRASGPRGLQDVLKKRHPQVEFVGDDYRYVRDGNFWSSGLPFPSSFRSYIATHEQPHTPPPFSTSSL